jgi:hypothetical protein
MLLRIKLKINFKNIFVKVVKYLLTGSRGEKKYRIGE